MSSHRPPRIRLAVVASVAVLWISACGDDLFTPSDALNQIRISTPNATIDVGESLDLVAAVQTRSGASVDVTTLNIIWNSSNQAIATVNSTGVVTGISGGVVTISATLDELSASTSVTVVEVPTETVDKCGGP